MNEKKRYEKAVAEVILFDNSDVITTSGIDSTNAGGGCTNGNSKRQDGSGTSTGSNGCKGGQKSNGCAWNGGNGCSGTSGDCPGQSWK